MKGSNNYHIIYIVDLLGIIFLLDFSR